MPDSYCGLEGFLQQFCEVFCPKRWISSLTFKIVILQLLIWEFWQKNIYNSSNSAFAAAELVACPHKVLRIGSRKTACLISVEEG